jgi:hypothetical protein
VTLTNEASLTPSLPTLLGVSDPSIGISLSATNFLLEGALGQYQFSIISSSSYGADSNTVFYLSFPTYYAPLISNDYLDNLECQVAGWMVACAPISY